MDSETERKIDSININTNTMVILLFLIFIASCNTCSTLNSIDNNLEKLNQAQ